MLSLTLKKKKCYQKEADAWKGVSATQYWLPKDLRDLETILLGNEMEQKTETEKEEKKLSQAWVNTIKQPWSESLEPHTHQLDGASKGNFGLLVTGWTEATERMLEESCHFNSEPQQQCHVSNYLHSPFCFCRWKDIQAQLPNNFS